MVYRQRPKEAKHVQLRTQQVIDLLNIKPERFIMTKDTAEKIECILEIDENTSKDNLIAIRNSVVCVFDGFIDDEFNTDYLDNCTRLSMITGAIDNLLSKLGVL